MTRFCEGCPISGSCNEDVVGTVSTDTNDPKYPQVGVLVDTNGGMSATIGLSTDPESRVEPVMAAIDRCHEPTIETKGIFRKRDVITDCPAIGRLAVYDRVISDIVQQRMSADALSLAARARLQQN